MTADTGPSSPRLTLTDPEGTALIKYYQCCGSGCSPGKTGWVVSIENPSPGRESRGRILTVDIEAALANRPMLPSATGRNLVTQFSLLKLLTKLTSADWESNER